MEQEGAPLNRSGNRRGMYMRTPEAKEQVKKRKEEEGYSTKYHANHKRVYRARGKARDQMCVRCGKQALEWAQLHDTDGSDSYAHFIPLCKLCHHEYDNKAEAARKWWASLSSEERALIGQKISDANKGREQSEDSKEKIANARRGKRMPPRSEEHRRRLSEALTGKRLSPEHRKAVGDAQRGVPKPNVSAALKRYWERKRSGEQLPPV